MNEEIKKIIEIELKAEGLELAEEVAVRAFKAIMKAAPKIALVTENKADDFAVQILPFLEPKVLALLDQIDGHVG